MKVNYLGTQYIHKFTNSEGEVVYVTCSNDDYENGGTAGGRAQSFQK